MLEVFYLAFLFRMAGKCWVIKLKRFVGHCSRFYCKELFPSLLLVAVSRVEKCSATGAKNKFLLHVCNV